jgi:protein ImuB
VPVACIDLPALPLQLVWRDEPMLRGRAVVVVDEDRPQGRVLWVCERARATGVLPGMRFAHALGLCGELHARVVARSKLDAAMTELRAAFAKLSPRVEPCVSGGEGAFWLDGDGLDRLYTRVSWAHTIARAVEQLGFSGAVVVGWSRFASYAIARAQRRPEIVVFQSDAEERGAAATVPLARLDIAPELRDALARLGVTTVGELVRLPAGGILERFGSDAHRLYELAAGEGWDPIVPVAPPQVPDERVVLDDDDDDVDRLVFAIKGAIDKLFDRLAARVRACTALHLELACRATLRDRELVAHSIAPAEPTLDVGLFVRLVRLRLEGKPPPAPVYELRVWADEVAATHAQLALFAGRARRDLRACDEAIAQLRAELGDNAVVRAVLRDGHLPEASFGWEPFDKMVPARPQPRLIQTLVRRIRARPQLLPQPHNVRDDGWLLSKLEQGAVVRIVGPYIVSGGWWADRDGREVHREYHFAELKRGECLWVYYDRRRHRWYWQGTVE